MTAVLSVTAKNTVEDVCLSWVTERLHWHSHQCELTLISIDDFIESLFSATFFKSFALCSTKLGLTFCKVWRKKVNWADYQTKLFSAQFSSQIRTRGNLLFLAASVAWTSIQLCMVFVKISGVREKPLPSVCDIRMFSAIGSNLLWQLIIIEKEDSKHNDW